MVLKLADNLSGNSRDYGIVSEWVVDEMVPLTSFILNWIRLVLLHRGVVPIAAVIVPRFFF